MGLPPLNLSARLDAIETENARLRATLQTLLRLLDQCALQIGAGGVPGLPSVLYPLAP